MQGARERAKQETRTRLLHPPSCPPCTAPASRRAPRRRGRRSASPGAPRWRPHAPPRAARAAKPPRATAPAARGASAAHGRGESQQAKRESVTSAAKPNLIHTATRQPAQQARRSCTISQSRAAGLPRAHVAHAAAVQRKRSKAGCTTRTSCTFAPYREVARHRALILGATCAGARKCVVWKRSASSANERGEGALGTRRVPSSTAEFGSRDVWRASARRIKLEKPPTVARAHPRSSPYRLHQESAARCGAGTPRLRHSLAPF